MGWTIDDYRKDAEEHRAKHLKLAEQVNELYKEIFRLRRELAKLKETNKTEGWTKGKCEHEFSLNENCPICKEKEKWK